MTKYDNFMEYFWHHWKYFIPDTFLSLNHNKRQKRNCCLNLREWLICVYNFVNFVCWSLDELEQSWQGSNAEKFYNNVVENFITKTQHVLNSCLQTHKSCLK